MNTDILKENKIHGSSIFPFQTYSIDYKNSGMVIDCHFHDELEFILVTSGSANFQIDRKSYEVKEGEGLFINSGEVHAAYPIENSLCSFTALVFNPNILYNNLYDVVKVKFIEPLINKIYTIPAYISGNISWERDVLYLIKKIVQYSKDKPFTYELLVKSDLYNIFSLILSQSDLYKEEKKSLQENFKVERLKKVLNYIHENYNKKITIKDLSSVLNMSEGYFCRFFKQMVRKTPIDYINYYRINIALTLLQDKNKKVIEVSSYVGFDNVSYFITTFKHYMNCTPREYVKSCRNKD